MKNSFLWIKIQLLLKRIVAIVDEDTITMGSESPGPGTQTPEGCTNILWKYHYRVLLRTLLFLMTGGLWLDPIKLVAPIWIHISACISSSECGSFNIDHRLAYLAVIALMLYLCPLPTRSSDFSWLLHDCKECCVVQRVLCCAKSEILMTVVTKSTQCHADS